MTLDQLNMGMLIGAAVLIFAIMAVRVSVGTGMPSLLIYLGLGLLLGGNGVGIRFDNYLLTEVVGYAALSLILAEGGLTTRWSSIRPSIGPAAVLATLGTVVSIFVTGALVHWALGMGWTMALLMGAIVSSTDAAAVFSVLRRVPLPRRLTGMLEAESGFNDAPVVIVVVALVGLATGAGAHAEPWWLLVLGGAVELVGGALVGGLVGWVGARLVRNVALPSSGLYPITVIGLCVLAYGASSSLHLSGFIAIYIAGLVLGNSRLPHRGAVRGFAEGLGWLAQIGLFVLLGMEAKVEELPGAVVPAVIIGTILLLVARPASVALSVSWFGVPPREQAFLSWAGLRGAVPIVLATVPVVEGVAGSEHLFTIVFVLVVIFTVVQGPTLPWVARLLRLRGGGTVDLDLESSPLSRLGADILTVHVGESSRLHGTAVHELRLPRGSNVTLVVRGDESFVPSPQTVLRRDDELLLVTPSDVREQAEARLRQISRAGRLSRWITDS